MVAKDWAHEEGVDLASWIPRWRCQAWEVNLGAGSGVTGLVEGVRPKEFFMAAASPCWSRRLGTPYEIKTAGTILFMEDVAAKPYPDRSHADAIEAGRQIWRCARHCFRRDAGLLQTANQEYTLEEVVMRIVGDLGIPVAYGVGPDT